MDLEYEIERLRARLTDFDQAFSMILPLGVNGKKDFISTIDFVNRVNRAVYSVGRVCVQNKTKTLGTGFLVAPDLLLTNFHVLPDEKAVKKAVFWIDYDEREDISKKDYHEGYGAELLRSSPEEYLDYALVRVKFPEKELHSWQPVYVNLRDPGRHPEPEKDSVIIVQHPNGGPRKIVLENSNVIEVIGKRIRYAADTKEGSSGSPVFDSQYRIIGLHHECYGSRNEAIDIREILEDAHDLIPK